MADKNKHNNDLENLLRYLNDQLTNRERYEFERQLERDTFLYEAFEGLSQLEPTQIEKDLKHIDPARGKHRKGKALLITLSVAAGFALVVLSVFWIAKPGKQLEESIAESLIVDKEPLISDTTSFSTDSAFADTGEVVLLAEANNAFEKESNEKQTQVKSVQAKREEDKKGVIEQKLKPTINVITEVQESDEQTSDNTYGITSRMAGLKIAEDEVDSASELFEVAASDATIADSVFASEEISKASKRPGVNANPEPLGGDVLYRQYLSENLNYPDSVETPRREVVRVKFKVTEMGEPFGFEILSSPGDAFSQEAIRVIEEGPKWSPGIKDGLPVVEEVNLRVVFRP
ncbi:MAG: energy transducer TonB [Prolixibacteraceae bacterium]|nr:energy transducer TonB [Prolixibacteraceae bacterium]